jgi:hypothetical protein
MMDGGLAVLSLLPLELRDVGRHGCLLVHAWATAADEAQVNKCTSSICQVLAADAPSLAFQASHLALPSIENMPGRSMLTSPTVACLKRPYICEASRGQHQPVARLFMYMCCLADRHTTCMPAARAPSRRGTTQCGRTLSLSSLDGVVAGAHVLTSAAAASKASCAIVYAFCGEDGRGQAGDRGRGRQQAASSRRPVSMKQQQTAQAPPLHA